jgi:hypothetical protein
MGLETIHLRDLLIAYPELHQGDLGKQRQHHRRRWGRCRAFVPRDLLIIGTEVEANLPLDDTLDQQTHHGEHR